MDLNYTYITDDSHLPEIRDWLSGRKYVVFDIESGPQEKWISEWNKNSKIGLDPYRAQITTAQIGDYLTQFIIDLRGDVPKTIELLKSVISAENIAILGVNLRYDFKMVMLHWNIIPKRAIDCMIMEQVIRAGIFPGKNDGEHGNTGGIVRKFTSMAALAKRYLDLEIDKDKDFRKTLWKTSIGEFDNRQLEYMAGDCIYPDLIAKEQKRLIIERELENVVQIESKLIPIMADMELTGIPFDSIYWMELLQEATTEWLEAEKKLDTFLQQKAFAQEDIFGQTEVVRNVDYGSTKQLARALDAVGIPGFVSSSGETLSTASPIITLRKVEGTLDSDLADAILEYRSAKKRVDSYGTNFLSYINPVTYRIHPDFTQCCLVTGRQSCSPGMQTIPRDSIYRQAFNSPDGYTLIILDASQIEARISSDLTKDQPAIEVFLADEDIYKVDGERIFQRKIIKGTPEGDALRQRAKAAWLGLSYGQGKKKFNKYTRLFLGEDVSKEETDFLYDRFFEIHHQLKAGMDAWSAAADPLGTNDWFEDKLADQLTDPDKMRQKLYPILLDRFWGDEKRAERVLNELIARKGKVTYSTTLLGRKRFFRPDWIGWWTAARNHPVQGGASDLQKATEVAFQEMHWEEGYDAHLINVVHDEIITLVREDQAEEVYEKQVELGTKVGEQFLSVVPMKIEGGISKRWTKF